MATVKNATAFPEVESTFKVTSRWASFVKDVLTSIKDLGIICFVLALFLFREPVLQSLERMGMKVSKVNLLGGIELNLAALSVVAEGEPKPLATAPTVGQSPAATPVVPAALPAQVASIEQAVLAAPESRLLKDWAIVVAGYPRLDEALEGARLFMLKTGGTANVFKKRKSYRLVVQLGDREGVEEALRKVRVSVPSSYLVSLASWCGEFKAEGNLVSCSAQ